jgi:hypothetical protein
MANKTPQNDEFYIGYLPEAPGSFAKTVRRFIVFVFVLAGVVAFVLVNNQKGFRNSTFELGQLTEVQGILSSDPVPMLKVPAGTGVDGQPNYKSFMLIGFGKFGAEATLTAMEASTGETLEGKLLTLEGTLIYYNGKTLLELTNSEAALKKVDDAPQLISQQKNLGTQSFRGEIADPKCFFGVMKPGEGKPHRSCAIRCISGGIPPVFKTSTADGLEQYFILTGLNGEKINQAVLNQVGKAVEVSGKVEQIDDWLVLRIDPEKNIQATHPELLGSIQMCDPAQLALDQD